VGERFFLSSGKPKVELDTDERQEGAVVESADEELSFDCDLE